MTGREDEGSRAILLQRRDNLIGAHQATKDDRSAVELDQTKVGRLSRMDALQSQAMSQAIDKRRESEIKRIDAALHRLNDGEYGYCLTCGEQIELKRLELDPAVVQCAGCAK